jgi:hypothetical protein
MFDCGLCLKNGRIRGGLAQFAVDFFNHDDGFACFGRSSEFKLSRGLVNFSFLVSLGNARGLHHRHASFFTCFPLDFFPLLPRFVGQMPVVISATKVSCSICILSDRALNFSLRSLNLGVCGGICLESDTFHVSFGLVFGFPLYFFDRMMCFDLVPPPNVLLLAFGIDGDPLLGNASRELLILFRNGGHSKA